MQTAQGIHSAHADLTHAELSDEQLDQVAGGFGTIDMLLVIGLGMYAGGWIAGLADLLFGD